MKLLLKKSFYISCLLGLIACPMLHGKILSRVQERVIGESVLSLYSPKDPSAELMENFFTYEMNRICKLGDVYLDYPIEVMVLKEPQVNAFATSGSFIFIYTGLLERLPDISEVMGVLSHEITHTSEHHIQRKVELQNEMNSQKTLLLATLPLIVLFPGAGELIYGMAIDQTVMKQFGFSQQMEYEADAGALKLLRASGYDTNKLVTAFENIGRYQSLDGAPKFLSYYATHPLTRHRIDRIHYHQKHVQECSKLDSHVEKAQRDYTLLLSDLESQYHKNPLLIGSRDLINSYKNCQSSSDYQELLARYPDSIVLRMKLWNLLRYEKNWYEFNKIEQQFSSDPYWNDLPLVIEGRAERDLHTINRRDFIRKYQKCLIQPMTPARVIKYLAQAYLDQNQEDLFHVAQAKYFLVQGDYRAALRELEHPSITADSLYLNEIKKEADLKWNTFRGLSL